MLYKTIQYNTILYYAILKTTRSRIAGHVAVVRLSIGLLRLVFPRRRQGQRSLAVLGDKRRGLQGAGAATPGI